MSLLRPGNPPNDAIWAPADEAISRCIDLVELLRTGQSAGLEFGRSSEQEVVTALGVPRTYGFSPLSNAYPVEKMSALTNPSWDRALYYAAPGGRVVVSFREDALYKLEYDSIPPLGYAEECAIAADQEDPPGHDGVRMFDLHFGREEEPAFEHRLRFAGRCLPYFSTLTKLMKYGPRELEFEFYGETRAKSVFAFAQRDQREICLIYELVTFNVDGERGRIHFDYCLREALAVDAA